MACSAGCMLSGSYTRQQEEVDGESFKKHGSWYRRCSTYTHRQCDCLHTGNVPSISKSRSNWASSYCNHTCSICAYAVVVGSQKHSKLEQKAPR